MSNLLVTPILFQYEFLDALCVDAAHILALDLNDQTKYQQFKISIFANFNRYLIDSILFMPNGDAESLFAKLVPVMQAADETATLNILRTDLEFFDELRGDFLNIIKTLKK